MNWEGRKDRECGPHRTLGVRAWCFQCSTYCYPTDPCPGCEAALLRSKVVELRRQLLEVQYERDGWKAHALELEDKVEAQ